MEMKIYNFSFRVIFFMILFFVISKAFDCSGLRDESCEDFTYAGTFFANNNERIAALNKFYQNYYYENSSHNKNYTFELDENEVYYNIFSTTYIIKRGFQLKLMRKSKKLMLFSPLH